MKAPDCSGRAQVVNEAGFAPVVWDNARDTWLRFPGNQRIPAITVIRQDGKEGAVNTNADPEAGTVRVHGVHPGIVLRDGSRVACVLNMAFDPVGHRPVIGGAS
jgi:type IV secretion system protein VirB9